MDVTATQKEWVSIILEKFLLCKLSDLPPEIVIDWLKFVSQNEEGKSAIKCVQGIQVNRENRVFRKLTKLAIMAILASEALLRGKNPVPKCYPQWEQNPGSL